MAESPGADPALPGDAALFAGAACGLLLTEDNGLIRKTNACFCAWLGRSTAELEGKLRLQDLLAMGSRIFHQTHWMPLLQMQGSVSEVKVEFSHANGTPVPMLMNAIRRQHPSGMFHEIALVVAEDRDRYELELLNSKQRAEQLLAQVGQAQQELSVAQARLNVALQSAQLHVWDLDPASGVRHLDASVGRLLGLEDGVAVSVERFIAAVVPEDREQALLALSKAVASEAPVYEAVYRVNGVDGVQRTVGITGGRVIDEATGAVQYVGVLQDISDLTAQRAAAEDRAKFAEQMMGIVSHDLRNPLFAIDLSANYLGRGELTAPQQQAVERIAVSVARAKRLVADLLDFTQARVGGGLAVQLLPIDLHDAVARFVHELSFAYPEHRIEHRKQGNGMAVGDPDRLAQLLGNLVSNAVAYGLRARPITVTSVIAAEGYRIEVHNEGTPIPPEVVPALFAPMARGEQATVEFRSIGLGLFIVSEIARAHRGRVEVVSSAEAGTRFSLVVPRRAAPT